MTAAGRGGEEGRRADRTAAPLGAAAETPPGGRWAGALLLAVGAAVGAEATTFDVAFVTDPLGPKAFPAVAAALLGGSGLALLLRPGAPLRLPARGVLARLAAAAAAFVAYALLLAPLGFLASTTLTLWALSLLFGAPRWRSLVAALAFSALLQVVFVYALALYLPAGTLWTR